MSYVNLNENPEAIMTMEDDECAVIDSNKMTFKTVSFNGVEMVFLSMPGGNKNYPSSI